MQGRITVILLGGTLGPSRLQGALRRPMLCLPLGSSGTLLTQWLEMFQRQGSFDRVIAVLNSESDAAAVRSAAGALACGRSNLKENADDWFTAIGERASWRGPAGIVRDVTMEVPSDQIVLVAEAHAVPPQDLTPLLRRLDADGVCGVVGTSGDLEPAGVYAFVRNCMELVPAVGYFDLKEQLLPALHKAGRRVAAVKAAEQSLRVRDRESYLRAVAWSLGQGGEGEESTNRVSATAEVSDDAVIDGGSILCEEVVVESGAVIHQSVVLEGARIGEQAVLSRCVVGPGMLIENNRRVVCEVVGAVTEMETRRRDALLGRMNKRSVALRESA